jgi:hypothetical protein
VSLLIRGLGLSLVALVFAACAGRSSVARGSEAAARAQRAAEALEREDFPAARDDLSWLVSRCDAGRYRRNALLLFAAVELDPMNPAASAHTAARMAGAYLLLPDADQDQLPVARALYRLATDLAGLGADDVRSDLASSEGESDGCAAEQERDPSRSLPAVPSTPTAARINALESALSSRSDSLAVLYTHADSLRTRVSTLEAEIQRVADLLKNETPRVR